MNQKIHSSNSSIFNSVKKVGGWTGISRVFGLIRDITTTSLLGASVFHDIFVVTLKIPNLFRRFFAEGAFNQAFIPVYSDYQKNNIEKDTKEFINSLAGTFVGILFVFTILVLIFAPIFIFIFAPGFYFDDLKRELAVSVLRIMFPYLALISLVAFAGGIQNTHGRFSLPASTPIIFNVSLITAAVFIAPMFEIPIFALAWGVLVAGFVQLAIQVLPLKQINRLPIPRLDFSNSGSKKVFQLMIPAILAGGIIQINLLVDTIFASLLVTGSPTWLYVSDRLIQFPMGIFAIAIGTVLLPALSKIDFDNNKNEFISSLKKGQRFVLFIGIPSFIGLAFCSIDLVSTLFYRGEFSENDVNQASLSLIAFSFGLPFFMLMKVLTPAFFARKDTKTPMYIALVSLVLNASLNYLLAFVFNYGHVGIAVGSSIAAFVSIIILEIILVKKNIVKLQNPFNRFNFSILVSSVSLITFLYVTSLFINFIELSELERVFYLLLKIFLAMIIYLGVARLINLKPLREIF
jgi:putative peptidoglycan lipid II flippase